MVALNFTGLVLLALLAVTVAILVMGAQRRILLRIGLRNVARKRGQVAIAVAGLLVSTSIISGSLVFSDSWKATLNNIVIRGLDLTDETVTRQGATGLLDFFPYSTYTNLSQAKASMPHVSAVAPRVIVPVAVQETTSTLFRTQVILVGYESAVDLGEFILKAGSLPSGRLAADQAIINHRLATRTDAQVGHTLKVFLGPSPLSLTVAAIVDDRGRGGWQNGEDIFVNLSVAQGLVGQPGRVNYIVVANEGGPTAGYLVSRDAAVELNATLGSGYTVDEVKRVGIDQATTQADQLSQLFIVLSSFSIVSGLLLIVSIFVMLAEERKTEMGISRALGMRRRNLVQAFVLEGFIYALVSAALGALVGVAVGATIIWVFSLIFEGLGEYIVISILPSSLALAFGVGALLTLGTIVLTSWYVSRLNIVRAIRDIPEPIPRRSSWKQLLLGTLAVVLGLLLSLLAFVQVSSLDLAMGISLVVLGITTLLLRRVNQRVLLTLAGSFIVVWLVQPYTIIHGGQVQILGFIVVGILLVLGGVLIVMANSEALLAALTAMVRRGRKLLPVVRTAVAYPMNKRFRTGMNIAMFALIIFTITTLAMFQSLFTTGVTTFTQEFSGGYDIVGFSNPQLRVQDFSAKLSADATLARGVAYHEELVMGRALARSDQMNHSIGYNIIGINGDFVARNRFTFYALAPGYATAEVAWRAVLENPNLAVVDRTTEAQNFGPAIDLPITLGGTVRLASPGGAAREVTIIGVLDQPLTRAVYTAPEVSRDLLNLTTPSLFYFKVAEGQDATALAKGLEKDFLDINLQTLVFADLIQQIIRNNLSFFQLLQGFLALGLIVGVAGLGVVTLRNVAERKNVMGALRALGFRRSMVLGAFLLENSFVALLGIALGVALGVGLAYRLRSQIEFISHGAFVIPWESLLPIVGIAYAASLLATFSPARRAARMPPAEALRIAE